MEQEKIDWLLNHGCELVEESLYPEDRSMSIYTKEGDYVTLLGVRDTTIVDFIYEHKLTNLMSTHTARRDGQVGCTVGVGFNENEQRWYGWTHRAYHSFGVGDKIDEDSYLINYGFETGQELKTLDECKECAILTSEYFD